MFDIYKFVDADRLQITTLSGETFIVRKIDILDTEDSGDEEDCLQVRLDNGQYTGFYPSQIASITVLD